jgi:hypothetical protein
MIVSITYTPEENHATIEKGSCTYIMPLHIAFVTDLCCLHTRRKMCKHPVDFLAVYLIVLINIVIYLGVKGPVKSHLPFDNIIRSSSYSPR